jgi:hypothetical protein
MRYINGFTNHKLIQITGNTGSGKTILAKKLSEDTGILYMEVNQPMLGAPNRLIFESTGMGQRTKDVVDMFPKSLVIKCELPHKIAVERVRNSTKVFAPHETRMKMTQLEFYFFCYEGLARMDYDVSYNFLDDTYTDVLEAVNAYTNVRQ